MILYAYAVVDPRAVVVKAVDTAIADCAVARTRSANYAAVRTHVCRINLLPSPI